ncbi:MAG TPA: PIN domain-containing protein [Phycisphaerae bacterium]|nr:PIN domain-containing protein [Phycisphaerae bacterium]
MVIHFVRALFMVVVVAIAFSFAVQKESVARGSEYVTWYILIPVLSGLAVILVDMFWRRKRLEALSGLFFGVLAGLVMAFIVSLIVDMVVALLPMPPRVDHPGVPPKPPGLLPSSALAEEKADYQMLRKDYLKKHAQYDASMDAYNDYMSTHNTVQVIKMLLGGAAVFLCVSFVLQTKDDFRFVIPYVEFSREAKGPRPLLLDTSVIIDGRIADMAETRILESEVLIPRFILAELQAIADSDDRLKRNRGRRGLDVLNRLQSSDKIELRIIDPHVREVEEVKEVDAKLVALGQHLHARVVTNDYNLNKIAQLRGVDVVNINDLANALKPIFLPGEKMSVRVIKAGEEPGQGVGFLDDGTMVVIEQGRDFIGRETGIIVTNVLQTSAGRMIFSRMDADATFRHERRT